MTVSSVTSVLNALLPCSIDDATRRAHRSFVATHLGASFAAFAVVPFYLVYRGAPDLADSFVLASALAPLAGACIVVRTGHLDGGRATTILGLVGLALILWFRLGAGLGCAVAWLVAAQIEAIGSRRLTVATALIGGFTLLAMGGMPSAGAARSEIVDAIFSAVALAYAATAAIGLSSQHRLPSRDSIPSQDSHSSLNGHGLEWAGDAPSLAIAPAARLTEHSWASAALLAGGQILEFDERGTVTALHGDIVETSALDASRIMARGFFDHVHVSDRPTFLKLIADSAHGAACMPVWVRLRSWESDDATIFRPTYRRLEMRALPGKSGEPILALIREAAPAQETATDRMTEIRHDLRTPLNAIIGFSEMLASRTLRPADIDKQFEYARMVHRSGQALLGLIDANVGISSRRPAAVTTLAGPKLPESAVDDNLEPRVMKRA